MTTRLKICGITRREDLDACEQAGVDAVGFVFWGPSRRAVDVPRVAALLDGRRAGPLRVGVFVDASPEAVLATAEAVGLDLVQLHGDRPVEPYAALGIPWIWVLRGAIDLDTVRVPSPAPRWVLLDAAGPGGAGQPIDWDSARAAVRRLAPLPVWLAGGITPDNAADALGRVGPAGLDVATGAERDGASAGEKDPGRIASLARICQNRPSP